MISKTPWRLEITPRISAEESMGQDAALLRQFEKSEFKPALRIYSWARPSITLGYSQKLEDEIDLESCEKSGIEAAVRPTGGGILFHSATEVAFGLAIRKDEPPRKTLDGTSRALVRAFSVLGIRTQTSGSKKEGESCYCFSYPSTHEIAVCGKKIMGLAQKKGRNAILQQGSIFTENISAELSKVLKKPFPMEDFCESVTDIRGQTGRVPKFYELVEAVNTGFEEEMGVEFGTS
jgi:lipoate-protein ligase A